MEKVNSSLNLLEQAWIATEVYENSNEIQKYGGIIDTRNIRTIADWIRDPQNDGLGIDKEKSEDQRLMNKYIIPITVTIPGSSESVHLELVVDSKYRDVAVIDRGESGNEKSFDISQRVKDSVEAKAGLLTHQLTEEEMENLKSALEAELPKTLGELVDEWTGEDRTVGDDELGPRTRDDVKNKAQEVISKDGSNKKIDEEEMQSEENAKKEEEAKKIIPKGQENVIELILEGQGLQLADITQVNEVQDASMLNEKAGVSDNRMSQDSNVTVIRVRNKAADGSPDHMIVIQDNKLIASEGKDKEIGDFIDRYSGKNNGVVQSTDNKAYDTLEFEADDGTVKQTKVYKHPEPSEQEAAEFLMKFKDLENEREFKLEEKRAELEREADPDTREAILNDIKYIQQGYANEFRNLSALYGVEIDEYENELDTRVEQAKEDQKTGTDHTTEDDDRDPREMSGNSYEDGRIPKYLQ